MPGIVGLITKMPREQAVEQRRALLARRPLRAAAELASVAALGAALTGSS